MIETEDVVARLRDSVETAEWSFPEERDNAVFQASLALTRLAADTIERLREENARLTGRVRELEIQRLSTLAAIYEFAPQAVAKMCDEQFDRSGALLGEVRELSRRRAALNQQ